MKATQKAAHLQKRGEMTTAEIAGVLTKARWAKSKGGISEGFLVTSGEGCVIVSWVSPTWNAKTMGRMLKNYEQTLKDYQVERLRSHLVVTGKK